VYVRPFPSGVGKWQISAEGGGLPHWSRTHHELLFESLDGHVMVASYTVEAGAFRADKPGRWTPTPFLTRGFGWDFALAPDGEHVAIAPQADNSAGATQHTTVFIFNFFDELRRLAPVASR